MVCAADAHHFSERQSSRSSRKLGCIPVNICDKKERNKNKCTSDAADELHQQHGPRTMLDMLVQKEMGVLAAVNNAMQ
jgi:hypothetical protein